jgi:hypothetical protein
LDIFTDYSQFPIFVIPKPAALGKDFGFRNGRKVKENVHVSLEEGVRVVNVNLQTQSKAKTRHLSLGKGTCLCVREATKFAKDIPAGGLETRIKGSPWFSFVLRDKKMLRPRDELDLELEAMAPFWACRFTEECAIVVIPSQGSVTRAIAIINNRCIIYSERTGSTAS